MLELFRPNDAFVGGCPFVFLVLWCVQVAYYLTGVEWVFGGLTRSLPLEIRLHV